MIDWAKHSKWIVAGVLAIGTTSAFAGRITLYEGQNFQGQYVTTNNSVAIVGSPAFANAASSIVVTDGIWEACTDAYFRGRCVQLLPGQYPTADVNLSGRIASVRQVEYAASATPAAIKPQAVVVSPTPLVASPTQVVINSAPVVATAQSIAVSPAPLINAPTAVVVTGQPVVVDPTPVVVSTGRVVLYEYPNFGGARVIVDRGQARDLDWANFGYGHRPTSIRVESGTWMFCSEPTFRGECRILGPGEYPQLSGPLVAGISSAQQVWRPEYGALNVYSR